MAYALEDLLHALTHSRARFLKHLDGLTADQWNWKPYPQCKSVHETIVHLVADDRFALGALATGVKPDYSAIVAAAESEAPKSREGVIAMLADSHGKLVDFVRSNFEGSPLDTPVSLYGTPGKLGELGHLCSEDYYHAGQVAFIRMATDPGWNYYAAIFSPSP